MALKPMIILSLLGSAATAAAEPGASNPTGKWHVDFADAQCVASRTYGTDEEPLHFVLKAPPLGEVMQIAVMKKASRSQAQQVEARISLDGGAPLKANMLMFSPAKESIRAYVLNMPATDFSLVRQAKTLSIRSEGLNETFALSQMEPLLKVVDDCVADLRRVWNIGDTQGAQSSLTSRAKAQLAGLIKSEDYPAVAINQGQTGAVRFAVLVNETGRVSDCTIIATSGVAALDAQTCAVVKERAKFEPARGADGKPAKDAAIHVVSWQLR